MTNKSIYAAALDSELHHKDSLNRFCKLFDNIADAFEWMKKEHTEEEIVEILSKLGFDVEAKKTMKTTAEPEQNDTLQKIFKTQHLLNQKEADFWRCRLWKDPLPHQGI